MPCCQCTLVAVGIVAVGVYFLRKHLKGGQFTENVSAKGKVAVVTGANTGLGYETVKELNLRGAKVYMFCRSSHKAAAAIKALSDEGCDSSRLIFVACDLSSKASVQQAAADVAKHESKVDILINNAGMWMTAYEKTADGHEMTWQANYLGPFLLTELLLPLIESADSGRIVNLSSRAGARSPPFDVATIDSEEAFGNAMRSYSRSKLANQMHARELARRLRSRGSAATANSVHPGVIGTDLFRHFNTALLVLVHVINFFGKTRKDGAQTSLYVALSTEVQGVSGQYFADCARAVGSPIADDDLACKQLYDYSLKAVGIA